VFGALQVPCEKKLLVGASSELMCLSRVLVPVPYNACHCLWRRSFI
jgi:hypothetical protein